MIEKANNEAETQIFKLIIGDYKPGYLYGNAKTHKSGPLKVRPIISQVTTPSFKVAKKIDALIKPYMSNKFMLKSRDEFINSIR